MGFDVVLRDAFAVGVPQPEEELRIGVALLGRLADGLRKGTFAQRSAPDVFARG